jgi:cobalt/nickel transport system permease protein
MSHDPRPDGRLRLVATLLVGISAALLRSVEALTFMLLIAVVAAIAVTARKALSWPALLRRLAAVNVFALGIWLTVPIDWRALALHDAGILLASQITLRINVIALSASLLLARMSGIDLARAVTGLGLPASLGALLAMAVRSVALLAETHARLERAMRARGYRKRFGWRSVRASARLATSLLVHAFVRSERISLGLRARGLSMTRWPARTGAPWRSLPRSEWALLAGVGASVVLAVVLAVSGP